MKDLEKKKKKKNESVHLSDLKTCNVSAGVIVKLNFG